MLVAFREYIEDARTYEYQIQKQLCPKRTKQISRPI
jgi:hypothetical protein